MIPRLVAVRPLENQCLWVRFRDGKEGIVDLSSELWGPVFESLNDPKAFAEVFVHPELETAAWPNGADLSPEFLYRSANTQGTHTEEA